MLLVFGLGFVSLVVDLELQITKIWYHITSVWFGAVSLVVDFNDIKS